MNDQNQVFRVIALSRSKHGDLIVEDMNGHSLLFLGSAGALSSGYLNPDFIDALLRRQRWEPVRDDRWYSLDELQVRFADDDGLDDQRLPRRLASALASRGQRLLA